MNGWEFLAAQQGDPALASIPVVILSALDGVDRLADSVAAAGYLRKPVEPAILLETLARFCRPAP
jgi:CheY-like chemotaxis protein